ncbi:MAG TPA: kelch repeat-containing protein [Steroidobacteraceae bacterium]|nr:kelch repeat-containing protein [Steroidobacteraceae bacterium]
MRTFLKWMLIGLAAALSGCGGSSSKTTTITVPLTYSIGGTIAGLSGTVVLQNNGADNLSLSNDGAFVFSVTEQPNAPYDITIAVQPANQVCSVGNASGTATSAVTNVAVTCTLSSSATNVWTWVSGANYVNALGVYGTEGTAAAGNTPGARRGATAWTDATGNLWLFGGGSIGSAGMFDDLWEFIPSAAEWVWQGGSNVLGTAGSYGSQGIAATGNNPGAREGAASWNDTAGNLWLFGGDSLVDQSWQQLNDLWRYNPVSGQWTWVDGANTSGNAGSYGTQGVAAAGNLPPARTNAISWVDSAGVFWLFGGAQLNSNGSYLAVFNDLWSFNPTTGLWTWVSGASTPDAAGVFGTQGVAASGNVPGARMGGNAWVDHNGKFWLFGGLGLSSSALAQEYNDLWEYDPASGEWTWVDGSEMPNAAGVYGTLRAAAAGDEPGARVSAVSWTDQAGNFWLFGGKGFDQSDESGSLNDLWEYSVGTGVWTWIGGASSVDAAGVSGSLGIAAASNTPGARERAAGWVDLSGNFWLFGGLGFDSSGVQGNLNDLWSFTQGH